jgi:hypothetical protein
MRQQPTLEGSESGADDVRSCDLVSPSQTTFPTLSTPLTSTVPFAAVTQIFDVLDDWLALR